MKNYDVVIIGGGASGLFSALQLNDKLKVAILEANYSCGKKILVTGNGRCNLTNINMLSKYFNANIDNYLKQFDEKQTLQYFNSIGLITYSDEEGRVYPITNSAKSVVDVIMKKLALFKKLSIVTNCRVENIQLYDNKYIINGEFVCNKVIIATGNLQNSLFDQLKIKKTQLNPSLVALKTKENTSSLNGSKVSNVKIIAKAGKNVMEQHGEVLFKDNGLSGIAIFNISALFARNKAFSGEVAIDLLPQYSEKRLEKFVEERCKIFEKINDIFTGMLVDNIKDEIFKRCKINEQLLCKNIKYDLIKQLINTIKCLRYTVVGAYDNNQVVSGGISLNDLTSNLQLIKYPNIYVVGEACDVDGECGGYNLQWAWTSAYIASKHILSDKQ